VADGITEAYLLEQFKLSQQVRDKVTAANMAVIQIRGFATRSTSASRRWARGAGRDPEAGRQRAEPLTAVEQEVYQVRNQSGQDPLNYPIKLNNKIAALMGVIESADHRPTQQTYEVFDELSKALEAELQKKNATLKTDLPRLNAAFQREKIEAVNPDVPAPPQTPQPRRQ
jgi:hypothetical protein